LQIEIGDYRELEDNQCILMVYVPPDRIVMFKYVLEREVEELLNEEVLHHVLHELEGIEVCDVLHNVKYRHPYVFRMHLL
jgi:hypothetical protein